MSQFKNDVSAKGRMSKAGYMKVSRVRQAHPDNLLKLIHYRVLRGFLNKRDPSKPYRF